MLDFKNLNTVAIGEAMVELAPVGGGQYRRSFAGDTFNTAWHMARALQGRAKVGFATRVGQDRISDAFVAELLADGLDVSAIGRDPVRSMGLYLIELDGVERSFHYWRDTSAARGGGGRGCLGAGIFRGGADPFVGHHLGNSAAFPPRNPVCGTGPGKGRRNAGVV